MYDVAIIGAGIIGLTTALNLKELNPEIKIAIIEKNIPTENIINPSWDDRVYAITPPNLEYLQKLTPNLDLNRVGFMEKIRVWGDSGIHQLNFAVHGLAWDNLAYIIESTNIYHALLKSLLNFSELEFIYETNVSSIESQAENISCNLSNGMQFKSKWLIAADGANSILSKLLNITMHSIDYYQSGIVANFTSSLDHKNIARQWFLPSGVLALLPLTSNIVSMVYATNQNFLALDKVSFSKQIGQLVNNELGDLELLNIPQAFPLKLQLIEQMVSNRVIIIGDAAHTIHPLVGQGINLGFRDVQELVKILATPDKITQLMLSRFNLARLYEVRKMQLCAHGLERLFQINSRSIQKIRNWGLHLVDKLNIVKQELIKQAVGN